MANKRPRREAGRSEFGQIVGTEAWAERRQSIDLGLALLSLACKPGVPITQEDIAAWCGCSRGYIHLVEQAALRKLRRSLDQNPMLAELVRHIFVK